MSKDQANWRRVAEAYLGPEILAALPGVRVYKREVADGTLRVITSREPAGFHLSISHMSLDDPPKPGRYPTWDEICQARDQFTPADKTFVQLLPPRDRWLNVHETTFHLWEQLPCEHNGGRS